MNISRRQLLLGASSVAAGAILAPLASQLPATAQTPSTVAYAVGTPGEYDWQAIRAFSPEDAFREWAISKWGADEDAPAFDPEYVTRVDQWDELSTVNPGDWLDAGLGHICERCGYETHPETGGRSVAGEVVCEECLTIPDRVIVDPQDVVEDLGNRIADEGTDDVREWLKRRGWWSKLPDDLWQKSIAFAAEDVT